MAQVEFSVTNSVATVVLNRPEARNAVNAAVAEALADITEEVDRREDVRVAILTGSGGHFCAGLDLKAFLAGENVRPRGRGFGGMTRVKLRKPMIAAVEGYALAGGFELALACDLIVAADNAQFGLPEVTRGLVANAGGLVRLPRQLPYRVAMEWVLTGRKVAAEELLSRGLINRLVPAGTALAAAGELAASILQNGPLAVQVSKQVIRDSADWLSTEMFDRQDEFTRPVLESHDAREGARAFAEKRKPVWRGA